MKYIRKITIAFTILFSGVLFFSCSKDSMVVEKNNDLSWKINDTIKMNDIRNRIGYDPRYEYVFIEQGVKEAPMLRLGDLKVDYKNTYQLEVKLTKALEKDVEVTLSYNAEAFEEVRNKYDGYKLGTADLVQFTELKKKIAKGTTSVAFEYSITNNSNFPERKLVPFSVTIAEDNKVKVLEGADNFIVNMYQKNVSLILSESEVTKSATLKSDGTVNMSDKEVKIPFTLSDKLLANINATMRVATESSSTGFEPAPEGMVGTIQPINLNDQTSGEFSFELSNINELNTVAYYGVPFNIVFSDDSGNEYVLPQELLVRVAVDDIPSGENIESATGDLPAGLTLVDATGVTVDTSIKAHPYGQGISALADGDNYNLVYLITQGNTGDTGITFTFGGKKNVKAVKVNYSSYYNTTGFTIHAKGSLGGYISQGDVATRGITPIVITFKEPINTSSFKIDNFICNYYLGIIEIEFYEE